MTTLGRQFLDTKGRPSGFDYMRIILALSITAYHTVVICYGADAELALWTGGNPIRGGVGLLVPCFFALSGFLVAGSLFKNTIPGFLTLRAARVFPALSRIVLLSALVIGPALTTVSLATYFTDHEFFTYFLNMIGVTRLSLPGLFLSNPYPDIVNVQLWTIPYELQCYLALAALSLLGIAKKPRLFLLTFIGVTVLSFMYSAYHSGFDLERTAPAGRTCILSFGAGALLYIWREKIPHNRMLFATALVASILLMEKAQTEFFAAIPVAYVTVWLGLQNPRKLFFVKGADYSYGTYLYGFVVQQSIMQVFPCHHLWYVNLGLSLCVSGFLAYLSWHFLEKQIMKKKKGAVAKVNKHSARVQAFLLPWIPSGFFKAWATLIGLGDKMENTLMRLESSVLKFR